MTRRNTDRRHGDVRGRLVAHALSVPRRHSCRRLARKLFMNDCCSETDEARRARHSTFPTTCTAASSRPLIRAMRKSTPSSSRDISRMTMMSSKQGLHYWREVYRARGEGVFFETARRGRAGGRGHHSTERSTRRAPRADCAGDGPNLRSIPREIPCV
jgi:hypothetical protein